MSDLRLKPRGWYRTGLILSSCTAQSVLQVQHDIEPVSSGPAAGVGFSTAISIQWPLYAPNHGMVDYSGALRQSKALTC